MISERHLRGRRRGGNRLPPDRYPARGPSYERRRAFGPESERRDRWQKERTRRCVDEALTRGELADRLAALLHQLLNRCSDTLLGPAPDDDGPACSGWWTRGYIHGLIFPDALDETDGDVADIGTAGSDGTESPGARTAGRWMAELVKLGWIEPIHRHRVVNGKLRGTSNLWRIRIPDHLREWSHALENRSKKAAGRSKQTGGRGRFTPSPRSDPGERTAAAAAAVREANEARRLAPCPVCQGAIWLSTDKGAVRCRACGGTGSTRPRGP